MKALIFLMLLFSSLAYAQSPNNCGNDYVCFYEKEAREREAYRYEQLRFEEEQLNEMQKQNTLLEQELRNLSNRQLELEDNNQILQQELNERDALLEAQEQQMEEDQFRSEEIP